MTQFLGTKNAHEDLARFLVPKNPLQSPLRQGYPGPIKACNVMVKASRKGATSSHTIKAKGGCLQHNRRTQVPVNVDPSRTHLNTSWEHDRIKNLASTRSLIRRAEKLYTEKTKQKCQASFAPLRETCVVCKESTTLEDAMKMAKRVEKKTGCVCLGVWIHKDEGHSRSKFRPDEPYQCNYHIHFLWDCQNPTTGKAIPLKRQDLRDMQDIAAESLGMERGIPASISGLKHLPAAEYKLQEVLKENERLRRENEELQEVQTGLFAKIQDAWKYKGKSEKLEKILENERKEHSEAVNALNEAHNKDIANLNAKVEELVKRINSVEWREDSLRTQRNLAENENKRLNRRIERLKDQIAELTRGKEQEQARGRGR